MATIEEEKFACISREEILNWFVEENMIEVLVNLTGDDGLFKFKEGKIPKNHLRKWAYFKILKDK